MLDLQWDFDEAKHAWFKQGEKKGRENKLIENLRSVIESFNVSVEKAMDVLKIPKEEQSYYASKLNESVKCTVLDSAWKRVDSVNPLEFKKGEQRVAFDFSKRNPSDRILCESEAGFIRNIWNLKD